MRLRMGVSNGSSLGRDGPFESAGGEPEQREHRRAE